MNYKIKWKELGIDLIVDIAASMLIAVGIYNFALTANFPVAGFSGIAIILYHLFGLPVCTTVTVCLRLSVWAYCRAQGMPSYSCAVHPLAVRISSAWRSKR